MGEGIGERQGRSSGDVRSRAPSCKINRHPLGDARPMPFVNVLPHRHEHEDDDVIVAREGLLDLALFGEVEHIAGHMRL